MKRFWIAAIALLVAVAVWAPSLQALGNCWDDKNFFTFTVRPRAMIVLDRSGSMQWDFAGTMNLPWGNPGQRLTAAVTGIKAVLDANGNGIVEDTDENILGVEFGYGYFYNLNTYMPPAGDSRVVGTTYSNLWSSINQSYATNGTPLAYTLWQAKEYMKGVRRNDPLKACRPYFILSVSDGGDNSSGCPYDNPYCGDSYRSGRYATMNVAYTSAVNPGDSIPMFQIGIGSTMPLCLKNTLEWAACKSGTDNPSVGNVGTTTRCTPVNLGGSFQCLISGNDPGYQDLLGYAFFAASPAELRNALMDIVRMIQAGAGQTFTTPSVPANFTPGSMLYASIFEPKSSPRWWGHMGGFQLKPDGSLPLKPAGGLDTTYLRWDAGNKLRARNYSADSLTLYTWTGTNRHTILRDVSRILPETLGVASTVLRDSLINFIYGDSANLAWMNDNFHGGVQDAGGPNPLWSSDSAYPAFAQHYRSRPRMLYYNANDGKLHMVTANTDPGTGGVEKYAYLPRDITLGGRLRDAKVAHDFNNDGPIMYMHVRKDINGNGADIADWRSIIVCGQGAPNGGRGGNHYFAMDITDPSGLLDPLAGTRPYPYPMWEIGPYAADPALRVADMGQTWGSPSIGSIRLNGQNRYVVFLGGGYDCRDLDKGKFILVVDAIDGTILRRFSDANMGPIPGKVQMASLMKTPLNFDRCYTPDIWGNIWCCDLSDTTNPANWTMFEFFHTANTPGSARPIFAGLSLARDTKDSLWVFAGTGDRDDPLKPSPTNYLYGIREMGNPGLYPVTLNNLDNRTNTTQPCDTINKIGWYTTLSTTGNQSVVAWSIPLVMADSIYQLAWEPPTVGGQGCASVGAGTTWMFVMYYKCPDLHDPSYKRNLGPGVPPPEIGWGLDPGGQAIGITPGWGWFNLGRFKKGKLIRSWREEY